MSSSEAIYFNIFETDNARDTTARKLASQFVWTNDFDRLLSAKHHVILGARGSGKTALAKMLSHEYLSLCADDRAREVIQKKSFIGTYVPMKLEWVGGLSNKSWMSQEEKNIFFQWRMNIATCMALTSTLESCINSYKGDSKPERIHQEFLLVNKISKEWFDDGPSLVTLKDVRKKLEEIEFRKQKQIISFRVSKNTDNIDVVGLTFEMELLAPFQRAVAISREFFEIPDESTWFLCLDEAEFLEEEYLKILNSRMRTYSDHIAFKITTLPYYHSVKTTTSLPLDVNHDFEYLYIDMAVKSKENAFKKDVLAFTRSLFEKRLPTSLIKAQLSLDSILGGSELLGDVEHDWSENGKMMKLLRRHCTNRTVERAEYLHGSTSFNDQIARKLSGALLLKDAVNTNIGNSEMDIYSGVNMFVQCSDGNPRRIIRMLNSITHAVKFSNNEKGVTGFKPLQGRAQNSIMKKVSNNALMVAHVEPEIGTELYEFLNHIGNYLSDKLHGSDLSTDITLSFSVKSTDCDIWKFITRAVALGLVVPNVNSNNPDPLPRIEGLFRLSYVLSPTFNLLPRKGKAIPLNRIYMTQKDLC